MTPSIIITNPKTGERARTSSRAYWTPFAYQVSEDRIEVAHIEAYSLGEPVKKYVIGLTEDELAQYQITPGIVDLSTPQRVIDGERPPTNTIEKPKHQRARRIPSWSMAKGATLICL